MPTPFLGQAQYTGIRENAERLEALRDIEACNPETQPEIERILEVLKEIMQVGAACFTLISDSCVVIRQTDPATAQAGVVFEEPNICFWTLVPENPQLMVIEDMEQDARTATSPMVTGGPLLRFYAAVPLVTCNKQRIGTLCLVDTKLTKFSSARAALLANCAEMLMWVLEGAVMAQIPTSPMLVGIEVRDHKLYSQACALVDTSKPGWQVMFANGPFTALTGCQDDGTSDFWSLVQVSQTPPQALDARQRSTSSELSSYLFPNLDLIAHGGAFKYDAELRMATRSQIHDAANEIGNPARCDGDDGTDQLEDCLGSLFFLMLSPRVVRAVHAPSRQRSPIAELKVGTVLGAGSYAKVYRGMFKGERVAVKVMKERAWAFCERGIPLEASLMEGFAHANLVELIAYKMAETALGDQHLWMILEFCDQGSFEDAVTKGSFRTAPSQRAPPCVPTIQATATEVAEALAYLHARETLHCDLSGGNVLLRTSTSNPHGFSVRLADFGLSRKSTTVYDNAPLPGNYSYLAPEVMRGGPCTEASDVFSLGVLIYEMWAGSKAWAGLSAFQIHYAMLHENKTLAFTGQPGQIGVLALQCMSQEPSERPTAVSVIEQLANV